MGLSLPGPWGQSLCGHPVIPTQLSLCRREVARDRPSGLHRQSARHSGADWVFPEVSELTLLVCEVMDADWTLTCVNVPVKLSAKDHIWFPPCLVSDEHQ